MRRVLVVALLAAALAFAAWRWFERARTPVAPGAAPADTASAGVKAVRLHFGSADGDTLVVETRELPDAPDVHRRVAALVAELDRGPLERGVAVLPPGTAAVHVYLDDAGLLTLDLSGAFVRGFRGGSRAEWLAVASLVRTLGDNVPEAKRILLVSSGVALPTLGGHVPLDRPLDPAEWP
uniref:GerMN domain-containing protein n=1 Tax=Eiseniibacteriota bacterium TaxID=2212470 RepID=A0A832MN81_UNCEI